MPDLAIYLDANVLPQSGELDTIEMASISAVAKQVGHEIVLPEIVLMEAEAKRYRDALAQIEAVRSAVQQANRFFPLESPAMADASTISAKWKSSLEERFSILPASAEHAAEALRREAHRVRPAREGKGARDAAIWLAVRDDHLNRQQESFFVSKNTKDFSNSADGESLHPSLLKEIAHHAHPLRYCTSLESLLGSFAEQGAFDLTAGELEKIPEVMRAVIGALEQGAILESLSPGSSGIAFVASPVTAEITGEPKGRVYTVDGKQIIVAHSEWRLVFQAGLLRRFPTGGYVQDRHPAELTAMIHLWIRQDADGSEREVEVAGVQIRNMMLQLNG